MTDVCVSLFSRPFFNRLPKELQSDRDAAGIPRMLWAYPRSVPVAVDLLRVPVDVPKRRHTSKKKLDTGLKRRGGLSVAVLVNGTEEQEEGDGDTTIFGSRTALPDPTVGTHVDAERCHGTWASRHTA